MSEKIFDNLIIGAGFYAVGAACANAENTFIAESGGLIGGEFVNCFNERAPKEHPYVSALTHEFVCELEKRRIIGADKSIHLGPSMYVLCDLIRRHFVNLLLYTRVIDIVKKDGIFDVTLYNSRGYSHIFAKTVTDTTSEGYISRFGADKVKKSLNAIVFPSGDAQPHESITHNAQSSLYTFSFGVSAVSSMIDARKQFYDFWLSRSGALDSYGLTLLSNAFAYRFEQEVSRRGENGILYAPSASYGDLIDAFNAGVISGGGF